MEVKTISQKLRMIAKYYGLENRATQTADAAENYLRVIRQGFPKVDDELCDATAELLIMARQLEMLLGQERIARKIEAKLDTELSKIISVIVEKC